MECTPVDNLIGPVQLDILDRAVDGARIILLSDIHVDRKKCPPESKSKCSVPIWTYLQKLFEQYQGPEYLDFFLETAFVDELRGSTFTRLKDPNVHKQYKDELAKGTIFQTYLLSLGVQFHNCLQTVKTACEFYGKPIRFHYSDVRLGIVHSGTESKEKVVIKQLQETWNISSEPEKVKEKHVKLISDLVEKIERHDVDYLFRLTKIDKQLKRIDKSVATLLRAYMEEHMDQMKTNLPFYKSIILGMLERVRNNDLAKSDGRLTFQEFLVLVIGDLFAPLFDIYTLARMIRHNMKRVIIYAGAGHIAPLRLFLIDKMGFQTTVSKQSRNENTSFQCIDMKDVPQPWFETKTQIEIKQPNPERIQNNPLFERIFKELHGDNDRDYVNILLVLFGLRPGYLRGGGNTRFIDLLNKAQFVPNTVTTLGKFVVPTFVTGNLDDLSAQETGELLGYLCARDPYFLDYTNPKMKRYEIRVFLKADTIVPLFQEMCSEGFLQDWRKGVKAYETKQKAFNKLLSIFGHETYFEIVEREPSPSREFKILYSSM